MGTDCRLFKLGVIGLLLLASGSATLVAHAASAAQPVEVISLRTAYSSTFRNPDGSMSDVVHAIPVHYQDASGAWQDIDTSLVPADLSGYALQNAAGPFTVSFAGSARQSGLVRIASGNEVVSFGPESPAPSVAASSGNAVSFDGVYPNTDLDFSVLRDGVKEGIVLHKAPTSAVSYRFPLTLSGLTVKANDDGSGGYELDDSAGHTVYVIPQSRMTDSSTDPHSGNPAFSESVQMSLDTSGATPALVVTPSLAWLQDPSRVYPVTIDPTVTKTTTLDTFVQTGITSSNASATSLSTGTYDSGTDKARALFKFDFGSIASDAVVSSATLSVYENWSWSCTAKQVNAYRITSSWTSSVNWSTQPTVHTPAADNTTAAKGFSSSCPAGRITFDLTGQVQFIVDGTNPNDGFELRAADETDNFGWKKFDSVETSNDPHVTVTYNTPPNNPTSLSPSGGTISTDTTPTLSATFSDPDGGNGHTKFQVFDTADGTMVASGNGSTVSSGSTSSWTVPSGDLTSGHKYYWQAQNSDGSLTSSWVGTATGRTYAPDQGPPSVPTLAAPSSSANVLTTTPTLTVNPSTDPDTGDGIGIDYRFQIATDSGFTSIVETSPWVTGATSWTVDQADALTDGQTYYWRAEARDNPVDPPDGTLTWSSGQAFNVRVPKLGLDSSYPLWQHGPFAVNEATGNLVVSLAGATYPTASVPMSFSLTYNSLNTSNNGLGGGWTLNAGNPLGDPPSQLVDHSVLSGSAKMNAVEIDHKDGSVELFGQIGSSNQYQAAPGDSSLLTKNADGSWTLIDTDQSVYTFSSSGTSGVYPLADAEQESANQGSGALTYTYSSSDPTKITQIADAAGRTLSFNWSCSGAIVCITGPDSVMWKLVGNGSGGTSGSLATVNDGSRDMWAIGYDSTTGFVNAVQDANDLDPTHASPGYNSAHELNVSYDSNSPARVSSVTDYHISNPGGSTTDAVWSFAYHPGSVSATATRSDHLDGTTSGTARTADGYTTMTAPNQQPSGAATTTYYDNFGQTMEIDDPLGNVTEENYNAAGQLIWSEDGAGNPTDYTWDTYNDVLTAVTSPDAGSAGPSGRPQTQVRYDEATPGSTTAPGSALQGLQGYYYTNTSLAGRPAISTTDSNINFTQTGGGWPNLGSQTTNFSVRWTGTLSIPTGQDGDYTFSTNATDGTRIVIDGNDVLEQTSRSAALGVKTSGEITLAAGPHRIDVEFFEGTHTPAKAALRWACGDCATPLSTTVIPSADLTPSWNNQTSVVSGCLYASGSASCGSDARMQYHHYASPQTGLQDYDLVNVGSSQLVTTHTYDTLGRETQEVLPRGTSSMTIGGDGTLSGTADTTYSQSWTYYGLSETATIPSTCGGGTSVSQAGLLKSYTPHGITATSYVYDSAGRPIAVTKSAGSTCNTYNAEGRLTSDQAPGESSASTYTYDPLGNQLTATNSTGTVTTSYDEANRVSDTVDASGAESQATYDANGNLTQRVAAKGALGSSANYTTSYSYDANNQLSGMTDPASNAYSFYYDADGRLHATQYPNGSFSWTDYNPDGWTTGLYNRHGTLSLPLPGSVPSDSSPILDYAYTYNSQGEKASEIRSGGSLTSQTTSYTYDADGRLSQVTLPNGTVRVYSYDRDGNRTQIQETPSGGSQTTVYSATYDPSTTPGLDQLTSVTQGGTTTYGYNSDGQTTSIGSDSPSWDGRGRMTGGSFGGSSLTYTYDPLGRLISRSRGGTTTNYLYACACPNGGDLFQTDGSGTITLTAVDSPFGDLAHYAGAPTTSSTVSYQYYNDHGDVAATADGSGTRTADYVYDPFGALTSGTAPSGTSEQWTAKWDKRSDSATGLVQMGARPYSPTTGRFLAVDPMPGGSLNTYDYASQNPINAYDLSGQWCYYGWGWNCPTPGPWHWRLVPTVHSYWWSHAWHLVVTYYWRYAPAAQGCAIGAGFGSEGGWYGMGLGCLAGAALSRIHWLDGWQDTPDNR
jgi:RHS repeat-associated protein